MDCTNKLGGIHNRSKWNAWFSPLHHAPLSSVIRCIVYALGIVGSCVPLIDSLMNLNIMARFPMPDRMPSEMAHEFIKRVCLDGTVATISGFVMGVSLTGLWSEWRCGSSAKRHGGVHE